MDSRLSRCRGWAPKPDLVSIVQRRSPFQEPARKINHFRKSANQAYVARVPVRMRGVRVVTKRWIGNAVDVRTSTRVVARTNDELMDVKSRGPDTPKLVSRAMRESALLRTVANKPGAPRRSRISVKTIAQGMPVDRLYLWYLPPAFCSQAGHG